MTREEFEYAIKSCGFLTYQGQTYYEESELIKAFEDMGLLEQEPILEKIITEIMQLDYDCEDVDYDYNDMAQTEVVHTICREEVLQIIDKYINEVNHEATELPDNMCTQRCCLKNHNLGIIECNEECYNRTLF